MAAGPLMCWDFFLDYHHRTLRRLDDLQRLKRFAQKNAWRIEWDFEDLIVRKGKVALVTDPSLIIRFATESLFDMNGYRLKEVIGKKPSLFQGEQTSPGVKAQIRTAIQQLKPFYGTLINYRKDGSVYTCGVEEYPVFTKKRRHTHFIAFEEVV